LCVLLVYDLAVDFPLTAPATTHISPLSLHDALPISVVATLVPALAVTVASRRQNRPSIGDQVAPELRGASADAAWEIDQWLSDRDRKSTRLNSSHGSISYAVFCLKKKTRNPKDKVQP